MKNTVMYRQILNNIHNRQFNSDFALAGGRYKNTSRTEEQKALDSLAKILAVCNEKVCVAIAVAGTFFDKRYYVTYNANTGSESECDKFLLNTKKIITSCINNQEDTLSDELVKSVLNDNKLKNKLVDSVFKLNTGYIGQSKQLIFGIMRNIKTHYKQAKLATTTADDRREHYNFLCEAYSQIKDFLNSNEVLGKNYRLINQVKLSLSEFYKINLNIKRVCSYFKDNGDFIKNLIIIQNHSTPNNQIHAEMILLEHIHSDYHESYNSEAYIGISKLSCMPCSKVIKLYNESANNLDVQYHGTHGKVYENWDYPSKICSIVSEEHFVSELENCESLFLPLGRDDATTSDSN